VTCPGPGCCGPRYSVFDDRIVREELKAYRRNGTDRQSRELVGVLEREGIQGATAVDIGAGIGDIGHALVAAGVAHLTDIDGSPAFLAAAREEAEQQGTVDRWQFVEGDYVALADDIGPAEVITLGRVLCCYEDWRGLVAASTARTRRLYGLVYPVSRWWIRAGAAMANAVFGLFTQRLRIYVHPDRQVDAAVRAAGFERIHARLGSFWQIAAYRRVAA
jgi:2-polyprenyl-3-methyl-5-hydroxy-6-metoxy-1,4-benzoquinol methylase